MELLMSKKTIKTLLLRSEVCDLFVKAVSVSARKQAFADQPLHSRCCSNTRPPCSKNNALRAQKPMMAVRAFFSGAQRNGVLQTRVFARETLEEANKFERLLSEGPCFAEAVISLGRRALGLKGRFFERLPHQDASLKKACFQALRNELRTKGEAHGQSLSVFYVFFLTK